MTPVDEAIRPRSLPNDAMRHLRRFARDVRARFPETVKDVVLFGSRARGDWRSDSDYDVAVLIGDNENLRSINHAVADLAYDHILKGYHIRPVAVSLSSVEGAGVSGLGLVLAREGLSIR